ncbi:MAG: hypothetical protein NC299_17385 [Lachnospiraceae bacterium]|nr:hypothetical protein [Lachnospiraceae bacterium]
MAAGKQIQRIYALGAKCGLLDRGRGADDDLHLRIKQWTQKDHISELTEKQADFIIARLMDYKENVCPDKPAEIEHITGEQQSLCFRLAYKLARLSPSEAEVREHLRGLTCKVTGREIRPDGDIFYKVTRSEGAKIIEILKRMIRAEERKTKRGDKNGAGTAGSVEPP